MQRTTLRNDSKIELYDSLRKVYEQYREAKNLWSDHLVEIFQPRIDKTCFVFNQCTLDLSDRPMTLQLIEIFLSNPNQKVSKKQIIQKIHGDDFYRRYSPRYIEGKEQNVIKLITRARSLLKNHYSQTSRESKWFHYNLITEEWQLLIQ